MSLCQTEPDQNGTNRALWVAVLLQVKVDIENEDLDSLDYAQAIAFVSGGGSWTESRLAVADMLELHPDDITRMGQSWIAARRLKEGLPAEQPAPARPAVIVRPVPSHRPSSTQIVSVPPLPQVHPARASAPVPARSGRNWRKYSGVNPFSPFRHQDSAQPA